MVPVPAHAFAVTDYHLSWLHAALSWWSGRSWPLRASPYLPTTAPDGGVLVDGSQEDIDLLVCWQGEDTAHVVAIEAKAYGAWGNAQVTSKVARLEAIRGSLGGAPVDVRLVLTSRHRPQKLMPSLPIGATGQAAWPDWMHDTHGELAWMPLSAPGLRLATTRCDEHGKPSAEGVLWRITGPAGA